MGGVNGSEEEAEATPAPPPTDGAESGCPLAYLLRVKSLDLSHFFDQRSFASLELTDCENLRRVTEIIRVRNAELPTEDQIPDDLMVDSPHHRIVRGSFYPPDFEDADDDEIEHLYKGDIWKLIEMNLARRL